MVAVDTRCRRQRQRQQRQRQQRRRRRQQSTTTSSSSSSMITPDPPPGPETFAAWIADELDHDCESPVVLAIALDDNDDDDDDNQTRTDVNNSNNTINAGNKTSLQAIRQFMGPADFTYQNELRQRRQHKMAEDSIIIPKDRHLFESVSYQLTDTAVWHNHFTKMLLTDHDDDDDDANEDDYYHHHHHHHHNRHQRKGCITCLREVASCQCLSRCCCSCRCRCCLKQHYHQQATENAVSNYLADTRFVTRLVLIAIGIVVSMSGFVVQYCTEQLLEWKITTSLQRGGTGHDGYIIFLCLSLACGFVAFLPVAFRPVSAGSGIAEAKAVLNGIVLPSCTDLLTAFCKGMSVILTASASLPVGLEGPMIFMGLSLGENAQRFLPQKYMTLLTERCRRDFAAVGTACGVSSAFLSPVGGVLFAMEEGSSFWSVTLAWRSFGAACVTAIFSYIWNLLVQNDGMTFDVTKLGKFHGMEGQRTMNTNAVTFRFYDYFVFALMGIAGGLLGAFWNECNRFLAIRRNRYIASKIGKGIFVLMFVAGMASMIWWLPHVYKICSPTSIVTAPEDVFRQFGCPDGEYNHLATLLLNSPSGVGIDLLFWEPIEVFDDKCLLIAGALFFVVLLFVFGSSVSMGIFIPFLYVGACFGRVAGIWINADDLIATFAIVGSVAMLGGVVRVLISITVIIITCTGLPYMVTPLMVSTLFARVSGQWLFRRPGIYDIILELKGIPFLEEESPAVIEFHGLRAKDIMSSPLVTLNPEMQVGALMEVLKEYSFLDFPVVDPARDGRLVGVIGRSNLLTILSHNILFYTKHDRDNEPKALKQEALLTSYRRGSATLEKVEQMLHESDATKYIDVTPYVEIAHYTLDQRALASRAYELFRLLGLRSLIVTGSSGLPVGVITRYDLKLVEELALDGKLLASQKGVISSYQTLS